MASSQCIENPVPETILSSVTTVDHRLDHCLSMARSVLNRLCDEPKGNEDPVCKKPEGAALQDIIWGLNALLGRIEDTLEMILDVIGERMSPPTHPTESRPIRR